MADEQFSWLEWPQARYAPSHIPQSAARAKENSNPHWRSPFYNSSTTSAAQTPQLNNSSSSGSQYYPTYQQQEKSYVRLEDVVPYPPYRWGPPPTHKCQRQSSYPESTSELVAVSLPQQSPTRPTSRQLPTPISQSQQVASLGESHVASNMYSSNDAKRRRLGPPVASQAPTQTVPKTSSPVHAQNRARSTAQNSHTSSNFAYTSSSNVALPTTNSTAITSAQSSQPTARRTSQQMARPGSQYLPPGQSRPTPQPPQRTASPATSQSSAPRGTQYPQRSQSKATSRPPSSASPQTATQNLPSRQHQYPSPNTAPQSLPQTVQPTATQVRTQQAAQQAHLHTLGASSQSASPPVSGSTTQSTPHPPFSQPVSRPAAQSATPPVPHNIQQTLPQQRAPSTQTATPNAVSSRPPQTTPQMAPATHTQAPPGPYGNLAAYSFQPENPADRSHLKRRMDIVSHLKVGDAAQKITYDRRTIARDVLIAAGRHPTEPSLNHHVFRLRDVFSAVDVSSDLSTFRWDLVDPGQPSRDRVPRPAQGTVRQPGQTAPQTAVQIVPPPSFSQFSVKINNNTPPQPPPIQQHQPIPQQTFQQPPPQSKPQPLPQFQIQLQAPPAQPVPAAVPSPQAKATAPSPSTPKSDMEKRRRGRPPGSTNKPKVAVAPPAAPTASYPVFACRWGNCQMELHNLDLLKKHLFKVHVSYSMVCGWKGCTHTGAMPAMELLKHVKETHLDALAWKLGDGPAVPTSVDRDSSTNTVPLTIPESNHPGNEDSLIFPASYSSIRAFNRVHGKNTQQEKAREIMKAVKRLKEHIGVGLDPGGCELATPLRNGRVSNDEEVYEVRSE